MMGLIPKDWVAAIDTCEAFTSFIRHRHAKFAVVVDMLQPINLDTNNQITLTDIDPRD